MKLKQVTALRIAAINKTIRPYLVLNVSFAAMIFFIFLYSAVFSVRKNNHPIPSYYELLSGERSPSSGLSRSFSEIIRGNFKEAAGWNKNGIPLFLFFLLQLFMRIFTSLFLLRSRLSLKTLVWTDTILSILLFLLCFRQLLLLPFLSLKI